MKSAATLLLLSALCLLPACRQPPAETPETTAAEPVYLNLGPDAAYVGKEACRTCHADKYETFVEAEMGRSFKPATLSKSAADFEHPKPVYDPHRDFYYLPVHRGEDLFIMEYRLAGRDTVYKRIEKIDYIIGSGQHTNSHIMDVNGYLYQMPLTWYAQEGKWDLPPKFAGGNNARFTRPIPATCMSCHNAMPDFVPGSENRFAEAPDGIDCERCHGPGSIHVEAKRAGEVVDVTKEIDRTIVNPRKLPIDRQFDVCRRCHMQGAAVWKRSPLEFRPALRLSDFENVFWPRYADSTHQFIMASHPDRLQMSACFTESRKRPETFGAMTCTTCHDPHVGVKTLGADHYAQVCASCHTPENDNLCAEDEAVRARVGDNCVSCHMPVSGSIDIPHVKVTDHFIRVTKPDEIEILSAEEGDASQKRLVRLAALIDKSPPPEEVAEGFLTYYEEVTNHPGFLDSAAAYLEQAQRTKTPQELARSLVRLWFWQKNFGAIKTLAPTLDPNAVDDAWTWYRIGEAFLSTGAPQDAAMYFRRAVDHAPGHLRFRNKLGAALSQSGLLDEALATFDAILTDNPKFEEAYNDRGFTRALLGDMAGAEADFRAALALDPDAILPLANLASLYFNTDRKAEARPLVKRLLELDPSNDDYRMFWNMLR